MSNELALKEAANAIIEEYKKVGKKKFFEKLNQARNGQIEKDQERVVKFVLSKSAQEFNHEWKELEGLANLKGTKKMAQVMAIVQLDRHLTLSRSELSGAVGRRSHSVAVWALQYFERIQTDTRRTSEDDDFIFKFDKISQEVVLYIKTLAEA